MAEIEQKPQELTGAQKFFTLVYQLLQTQDSAIKLYHEIKKETDAVKLADLKARYERTRSNNKAIEKLVRADIEQADDYYTKHQLKKFWL